MTLGYCILHANRIDTALAGAVHEDVAKGDEVIDLVFGTFAVGEPDQLLSGYLEGVVAQLQGLLARVRQAGEGGVGLLAELQRWVAGLASFDLAALRLTPLVDRAADLLAALDPSLLVEQLDALLERLAVSFPELTGGGLLDRVVEVALGGLDALERRRVEGHDDLAAHRTFRMARIIRAWIRDALADVRARLAELDPIAWLRRALSQILVGIDVPGSSPLRELGELIRTKLRPFALAIDALLALRVSVSVSASASGSAQPLPDEGELWLDEAMVTPHPRGHWLWVLDLVTGAVAFIESIIDAQRFGPFYGGRWFDALLTVLNLTWQVVRTSVRAARPEFLRKHHSRSGAAFWFSELGDFCVQLLLNLLGSFHEGKNGANWAMSLACRLSRWFSFTLQPRIPYLFARAVDYQQKWLRQGWVIEYVIAAGDTIESIASAHGVDPDRLRAWNRILDLPEVGKRLILVPDVPGEGPGRTRAPIAFGQHVWLGWAIAWLLGVFFGLIQTWTEFRLQDLATGSIVKIVLSLVFGLIALIVIPGACSGWMWPSSDHPYEVDWLTFSVFLGMLLIITIVLSISMKSTNATRGIWGLGLGLGLLILVAFGLLIGIGWGKDTPTGHGVASISLYVYAIIVGLIVFNLLTLIYWWTYVDDGRDKHEEFKFLDAANTAQPLDPATAPYKLPWKSGDVWICGQGFHGNFSHTFADVGNHFGYDFLEVENTPASAARAGIVVAVTQRNPNNNEPQNDIHIQHFDWVPHHDPGTDDERVLTSSEYIHLSQNHAHVHIDQYVLQGQHVVDIDSTGTSAQHHLHFGSVVSRTTEEVSALATVDAEYWTSAVGYLHQRRNNNVAGRSTRLLDLYHGSHRTLFADDAVRRDRTNFLFWSFAGRRGTPGRPMSQCLYESQNPLAKPPARPLSLQTRGGDHQHTLALDLADLPLDGQLAAPLQVWTDVVEGHRHRVTISAAALETLLGHHLPSGFASEATLGHTHEFAEEARSGAVRQEVSPLAQVGLTTPPPAQLVATNPGPYDLLGRRLVLAVDDASVEFHQFAGARARLLGDLAIDRVPASLPSWSPSPSVNLNVAPGTRDSTRQGLATIDAGSQAPATPATRAHAMPFVLRAIPVVVLETLERGTTARLAVERPGASVVETGSGTLAQRTLTREQLRALFEAQLNQGPSRTAPAPADVHAQVSGSITSIDVAGHPVVVSGSPRARAIFAGLYEPATKQLHGAAALPLGPLRASLAWGDPAAGLELSIVGEQALLELDPASAWLGGARAHETPLAIRVGTSTNELVLAASPSLADIAAQIHREVEGVRAWVAGTKLCVATLDVGAGVELAITKKEPGGDGSHDFAATARGAAPKLAGTPIADSSLIERAELVRAIEDAATRAAARDARARAIVAAPPTKFAVTARLSGTRIELELPGHPIELIAAESSLKLRTLLGFTRVSANLWRSAELPDAIELPVDGWLDFTVDGDPVRVHLDGQPARVELPAFEGVWAPGDRLRVQVGGPGEAWTEVDLRSKGSPLAIVRELASRAGLIARISHRVAIEARHPGNARLGLEQAEPLGFVRRGVIEAAGAGPALDLRAIGAGDFLAWGQVVQGRVDPSEPFVVRVEGVAPHTRVRVEAPAGKRVRVEWVGVGIDPLGFDAGIAASVDSREFEALALPTRAGAYRVEVLEATDPVPLAATYVQLGATPASLRAVRPPAARPLVAATRLTIEVGLAGATQSFELDLGWAAAWAEAQRSAGTAAATIATTLRRRLVDQIQRETVGLDAWLVSEPGQPATGATIVADRVQLESRVAGKQARLQLSGDAAILALGFDPAVIGPTGVIASGAGELDDVARVRPSEVVAAFQAAIGQLTRITGVAIVEARESATANKLDLVSTALTGAPPALTLAITPAALDGAIPRTSPSANRIELDLTTPLDLPAGRVTIERGGRAVALLVVHGSRASLQSALPSGASEQAELAWLAGFGPGRNLQIDVDGVTTTIAAFPAGLTTLDAAIAHLADQVPALAIGVRTRAGVRELWLASRTRGARSRVGLRFVGFTPGDLPHHSFLGFTRDTSALGSGTFDDLGRVDRAALLHALRLALRTPIRGTTAAFDATPGTGKLDIAARSSIGLVDTDVSLIPVPGEGLEAPSGEPLAPLEKTSRGHVLSQPWPATRAIRSGILSVRWHAVTSDTMQVASVPVWGVPARLELGLRAGRSLTGLRGRKLAIKVDGVRFTCTFSTATASWASVVQQLERAAEGSLIARTITRAARDLLVLTSAREGMAAALELASASPDARDLLESIGPTTATGDGPIDRLDAVSLADLATLLRAGFVSRSQAAAHLDVPTGWNRAYVAGPKRDAPRLRIRSSALGCVSSIVPIVGGEPFAFDRSLQRGPAVGAALVIPVPSAVGGRRTLNGRLTLEFDESSAGPVKRVEVELAGDYLPGQLARAIHEALSAQEAGMAGAYADGSIVIETRTRGLAGALRLSADPALLGALDLTGATLFSRGWPGLLESNDGFCRGTSLAPASATAYSSAYFPARGFRASKTKPIAAGVEWQFHDREPTQPGVVSSGFLALDPTWNIDTLVQQVDAKLRAAGLGHAKRADDGTLQIEAAATGVLVLQVREGAAGSGRPLGVAIPDRKHPGERIDVQPDPGLDLRVTDTLRTVRLVYDRKGLGDTSSRDGLLDAGWVRAPSSPTWGIARDHQTWEPLDFPMWPRGRYLLAVRAEAAKHDYGRDAEMVASAGSFVDGTQTIHFVRVARYWVGLTGMPNASPRTALVPLMNGVRRLDGQILIDWSI